MIKGGDKNLSSLKTKYNRLIKELRSIIEPKSIALVGASDSLNKVGGVITRNLLSSEYRGKIYLVNPRKKTIMNRKVYSSLLDISENIDLVEIVVPAQYTIEVVKDAAKKNVKGIIIISSGFAEVGNKNCKMK